MSIKPFETMSSQKLDRVKPPEYYSTFFNDLKTLINNAEASVAKNRTRFKDDLLKLFQDSDGVDFTPRYVDQLRYELKQHLVQEKDSVTYFRNSDFTYTLKLRTGEEKTLHLELLPGEAYQVRFFGDCIEEIVHPQLTKDEFVGELQNFIRSVVDQCIIPSIIKAP